MKLLINAFPFALLTCSAYASHSALAVPAPSLKRIDHVGPLVHQIEDALNAQKFLKEANFQGGRKFSIQYLGCQTPGQTDDAAQGFCSFVIPGIYSQSGQDERHSLENDAAEPLARSLQIVDTPSTIEDGNLYRSANKIECVVYGDKDKDMCTFIYNTPLSQVLN